MNLHDVFDNIITFTSGVIIPISIHYYNKLRRKKQEKKKDKLKEEVQFSIIIDSKIDSIRKEYVADRVWVNQFHNGGYYYPTGKSIQKFSMFYESTSTEVSPIKLQFQGIPISLFSKAYNELLKNEKLIIPDINDDIYDNFGLRNIAEETECKSLYQFSIKSIDDKFIGILGVEYKEKHELSHDDISHLMSEASSIGGVVIQYLNK